MNALGTRTLALCMSLMLASCALLQPPTEMTTYAPYLMPVEPVAQRAAPLRQVPLIVEPPRAFAPVDDARIVVAPVPGEIRFYKGARWRAPAPMLFQDLLLQAFDESAAPLRAVAPSSGVRAEYVLHSALRAFSAEYRGAPQPTVNVQLAVQLVRRSDANVIAARTFEVQVPCRGTQLPEVFAAFQLALNRVVRDVVDWTATAADAAQR